MRNYIATLAAIIFALTFLGTVNAEDEVRKKVTIAVGPSEVAFKKNLAQDFCAIFKSGPQKGDLEQADGRQILTGVCSNTPQGSIPKVEKMPSTLILKPRNGQKIKSGQPFTVSVKVRNLQTGFFSDPALTYNAFPQELNEKGIIQGHQHVTIEFLGRKGTNMPNAQIFAFFKGLNDRAKNGILSVEVADGLKEKGVYRVCTIMSSFSHQAVVLPKAQRGASDDCCRFTIV